MNDTPVVQSPAETAPSGQEARRKFLRISGKAAVAAPAAVLLLSAPSTNARAQVLYSDLSSDNAAN